MLIYLVGFMGAGKSTIGQFLAQKLNIPFIDLDCLIQQQAGMNIPEIFADEGEAGFRKRETAVLLDRPVEGVIATGGGIVENEANREFLKSQTVVFLKARLGVLKKRIANRPGTRPLADNKLDERFLFREPLYLQIADLVIETENKSVDEIVWEVCQWMSC